MIINIVEFDAVQCQLVPDPISSIDMGEVPSMRVTPSKNHSMYNFSAGTAGTLSS